MTPDERLPRHACESHQTQTWLDGSAELDPVLLGAAQTVDRDRPVVADRSAGSSLQRRPDSPRRPAMRRAMESVGCDFTGREFRQA